MRELKIVAADVPEAALMVKAAERGEYDDIHTPHAFPKMMLVRDLREIGREDLAQRVIAGEFDSTREEWEAVRSPS